MNDEEIQKLRKKYILIKRNSDAFLIVSAYSNGKGGVILSIESTYK